MVAGPQRGGEGWGRGRGRDSSGERAVPGIDAHCRSER